MRRGELIATILGLICLGLGIYAIYVNASLAAFIFGFAINTFARSAWDHHQQGT